MILRPKNHNKIILLYVFLGMVLLGGLGFASYLLFDKIGGKSWDEIKTIIIASVLTYLTWIQLAYRLILDIVLYVRKFKNVNKGVVQLIEQPSKYVPKESKKIKQDQIKDKFVLEKQIGDNLVRVTNKDIVIVYGREFIDKEDYYNAISYTFGEIKEIIRKKEPNT